MSSRTSQDDASDTHETMAETARLNKEPLDTEHVATADSSQDGDSSLNEQNDDLPVDRGWAWVILLGCSLAMFILVGPLKSFGVFFVNIQQRYEASSSETSLMFTLQNVSYSIASLLVMTMGGRFSTRALTFIGGLLLCSVYIVAGFLSKLGWLIVVYGVGTGIGYSFVNPPLIVQLNTYFRKYRGLSNSLVSIGVGGSGLAMAPFFTWLFETYGYTGTMILTGGFFLHILVIALLMRDINSYKRRQPNAEETQTPDCLDDQRKPNEDMDVHTQNLLSDHRNGDVQRRNLQSKIATETKIKIPRPNVYTHKEIKRKRNCISECQSEEGYMSKKHIFSSVDGLQSAPFDTKLAAVQVYSSCTSIPGTSFIAIIEEPKLSDNDQQKSTLRNLLDTFNLKILCNPVYIYFLVCNIFLCPGNVHVGAFVIPHANDLGVSAVMAAWLVSAGCIADIVTKLPCGYLADSGVLSRSTIVAGCSAVIGIACLLMHFANNYVMLMCFSVLVGVMNGVYFCLIPVVILDFLPMEDLKVAMGFLSLVQGIAVGLTLPVTGQLRDNIGTYYAAYYFLGAILMVGSLLMLCLPRVHRWRNAKSVT